MLEFSHVIADPEGFHARPVTRVCSEARLWESSITIAFGPMPRTLWVLWASWPGAAMS